MKRTSLLSSSLLVYAHFFLKDHQQVRTISLPPVILHASKVVLKGQSFCLLVRLQFILQLIMQQPRWLIRSKQRAFNPIHVGFFFFLSSMSSLSNTIRCRMQSREEAGAGHTCLAGLRAGSWEAHSQRTVGCTDGGARKTWGKATLWLQLSAGEGALWGLQAEKHFLG